MRPHDIQNPTRVMRGPGDVQDLQIVDIPDPDPNIGNWQVSAWKPTRAELERLAAGAAILLYIAGNQHPIVGLQVEQSQ